MKSALWKQVLLYGAALAGGALALQLLNYQFLARVHAQEIYWFLIATAFLGLGVFVGARVFGARSPAPGAGNLAAVVSLRISPSELTVLRHLAAGRSNKEIAAELDISPNTVKTHVARLFEKLDASRRTDAINRARELGILS